MSEVLIKALTELIATKEAELDELKRALRDWESKNGDANTKKTRRRFRKETGPTEGSIPFLIKECLKEVGKPLGAADLSERLKKKEKNVASNAIAAALSRYIAKGRVFEQTSDGLYALKKGV